jgi:hypothetical protein
VEIGDGRDDHSRPPRRAQSHGGDPEQPLGVDRSGAFSIAEVAR